MEGQGRKMLYAEKLISVNLLLNLFKSGREEESDGRK